MSTRTTLASAAALLALGLSTAAHAVLPTGQLVYSQPSGVVGPGDSIQVWVTFTLDADSVPLNFSSNPLTGIDAADLPTLGDYYDPDSGTFVSAPFATYTGAFLNTYFSCSGNFTSSCISGPPYDFNFWTSSEPGLPSVNFLDSYSLAPGASTEYLFGTFVPQAGGAPAGTYTFFNTGLTLNITGMDADGHELSADIADLATSCDSQEPSCAFTRTVVAVPEPTSYGLMSLGLIVLGGWLRRRQD